MLEFTRQIIIMLRIKSSIINVLFVFFAFQMPQESPHETNDATNSLAPSKKCAVYQEVNFVSKNIVWSHTSEKLTIFLFFFLFFFSF